MLAACHLAVAVLLKGEAWRNGEEESGSVLGEIRPQVELRSREFTVEAVA